MLTRPLQRRPSQSSIGPLGRSGAANDNRRLRVVVPTSPRRLATLGANVLKLNPYFRLAGMAMNVLDVLSNYQGEGFSNLGPWTRMGKCETPNPLYSGPLMQLSRSSNANATSLWQAANSCLALQAVATPMAPFTVNDVHKTITLGKLNQSINRWQVLEAYSRPENGPDPTPVWHDRRPAIALPANIPANWPLSVYPELAPPNHAPAFPHPRPYSKPYLRGINSSASYGAKPKPMNSVPNNYSFTVDYGPSVRPEPSPDEHTLAPPSGAQPLPSPRRQSRPAADRDLDEDQVIRRTRETKYQAASTEVVTLLRIAGQITEGIDLINSIYDALPAQYRVKWGDTDYERHNVTPLRKMRQLIDNYDKIDLHKAIHNIINDNLQDILYGTVGQFGGEASRRAGLLYGGGLNTQANKFRKLQYDAEEAMRERRRQYNDTLQYSNTWWGRKRLDELQERGLGYR